MPENDPVPRYHDRHARGTAAYARIFGVPEDRLPAAFAARVGPVFAEEQLQAAGGPAWSDPSLSGRDRSIAVITALVAQGVTGDRLEAHSPWKPSTLAPGHNQPKQTALTTRSHHENSAYARRLAGGTPRGRPTAGDGDLPAADRHL